MLLVISKRRQAVVHSDEIEIDKSTSKPMLSVLTMIQESMNSSSVLLRKLLQLIEV